MKGRRPGRGARRPKDYLKGSLMLGLESTASRMTNLARQDIYFDRHSAWTRPSRASRRSPSEDVPRSARDLFSNAWLAATVLGQQDGRTLAGH